MVFAGCLDYPCHPLFSSLLELHQATLAVYLDVSFAAKWLMNSGQEEEQYNADMQRG
jgi:hypothetical protein